jgi:hypothetical protein
LIKNKPKNENLAEASVNVETLAIKAREKLNYEDWVRRK